MTDTTQRIRFDLSPDEIPKVATQLLADYKRVVDAVVAIPRAEQSVANVLEPLLEAEAELTTLSPACDFPQHVSPDKAVRDASCEAEKVMDAFLIDESMRVDVYETLKAFSERCGSQLTGEKRRWLEFRLRDCRRNGLNLPDEKRQEVARLKKLISEKCTDFSKNCGEDASRELLTREELTGLPDDFIESLDKEGDKFILT